MSSLHPNHLKLEKKSRYHLKQEKPGVYFLPIFNTDHKNKRGSETHTYYERDANGETREGLHLILLLPNRLFQFGWYSIEIKTDQYSPVFDTAPYHIIFKIKDENTINNELEGKILNLLYQMSLGQYAQGRGCHRLTLNV